MPPSSTQRAKILRVLDRAPEGLTTKQVCRMTGLRHPTVSGALAEMSKDSRVFRLAGFNKPYHWITPDNLRGREFILPPLGRKDVLIHQLQGELETLKLSILLDNYPTPDSVGSKSVVEPREQEQSNDTEHSRIHAESHH